MSRDAFLLPRYAQGRIGESRPTFGEIRSSLGVRLGTFLGRASPQKRRNYSMTLRYLAGAVLLFLAACASDKDMKDMPAVPLVASVDAERALGAVRTSNQAEKFDAGVRASDSLPRFGSVTQSSNRGEDRVSSDAASAAFDGQALTVSIARENAGTITFDTATDIASSDSYPSPIPGHDGRAWTVLNATDEGLSVSFNIVSWDNDNPADYLAAGYWLHLSGDARSLEFDGAEVGVFVDGPELSTMSAPDLPVQGQARYVGPAQGFYIGRYGTDVPAVTPGSMEVGEFFSSIELTADFGEHTMGGCMGCRDGILFNGVLVDGDSGAQTELGITPRDFRVRLAAAPIRLDGTFRNHGVTVETIETERPAVTITRSSGSWGGKFSNVLDSDGDPRLAAGTVVGSFDTAGGGQAAFLGSFFGLKQPAQ